MIITEQDIQREIQNILIKEGFFSRLFGRNKDKSVNLKNYYDNIKECINSGKDEDFKLKAALIGSISEVKGFEDEIAEKNPNVIDNITGNINLYRIDDKQLFDTIEQSDYFNEFLKDLKITCDEFKENGGYDFSMNPEEFKAKYINNDGQNEVPVITSQGGDFDNGQQGGDEQNGPTPEGNGEQSNTPVNAEQGENGGNVQQGEEQVPSSINYSGQTTQRGVNYRKYQVGRMYEMLKNANNNELKNAIGAKDFDTLSTLNNEITNCINNYVKTGGLGQEEIDKLDKLIVNTNEVLAPIYQSLLGDSVNESTEFNALKLLLEDFANGTNISNDNMLKKGTNRGRTLSDKSKNVRYKQVNKPSNNSYTYSYQQDTQQPQETPQEAPQAQQQDATTQVQQPQGTEENAAQTGEADSAQASTTQGAAENAAQKGEENANDAPFAAQTGEEKYDISPNPELANLLKGVFVVGRTFIVMLQRSSEGGKYQNGEFYRRQEENNVD